MSNSQHNRTRKFSTLVVWQWNCRGFQRKRAHLEQFIKTKNSDEVPDVVCLQETGAFAKLSNYKSFSDLEDASGVNSKQKPTVATLVRRNLPAIRRDTGVSAPYAAHVLVELIPDRKHRTHSTFILNVSSPRNTHKFGKLLRKTLELARGKALVIVGDFNAHHPEWGYKRDTIKGRNLWLDAQREGLTLITDPTHPTRIGNSVSGDTTPDLTFTKNTRKEASWLNTQENLGSDHYLVAIGVESGTAKRTSGKRLQLIDWDTFREIRAAERASSDIESNPSIEEIADIQEWAEQLRRDAKQATKEIPEDAELYQADAKLLHMWEAKHSLHQRLQTQKLNRTLRRRLAILDRDIEDYADQLSRQNWHSTCDRMEHEIGLAKTWNILRCLIDPDNSKTTQRHNLNILLHKFKGSDTELIKSIKDRYIGDSPREVLPPYTGQDNDLLDRPITVSEVRGAILALRTRSAPGPDGITNKMLRNLDNDSVEALTRYDVIDGAHCSPLDTRAILGARPHEGL
ncbi:hypothetical protein HPB47_016503 [Ixodes persulcatus]|uniref:Uncharacterized protein n=1 Tax=Ixodes persulcatus TaxID=34615 RepID=A0AC60QUE8_IXOPE|nr:hypothetical protein HPB47_016503 [Ixodes persulcatus]